LVARRWPNGVICPRCGNAKVYKLASGFHWQCEVCAKDGYRFSCIAGPSLRTLTSRSRLVQSHSPDPDQQKGHERAPTGRYMGFGSVKTAWLMAHKIRTALIEPETKLGGIVEVDETFVGGRAKNRHADKRDGIPGPTVRARPSLLAPSVVKVTS